MQLQVPRIRLNDENATVAPPELFFDLVFVFALTQVTALMADDLTRQGLVRGMLVLALLWWSWTGYAWLCNVVNSDTLAVRFVLFAAMAAMFVLALSSPRRSTTCRAGWRDRWSLPSATSRSGCCTC